MADGIITRAAAKGQGLKRYFTGKLCKRGHLSERLVSNRECLLCVYANPEKERERKRRQTARNPETARDRCRRYQDRHRDQVRARSRKWKEENRERARELSREWRRANPGAGALWHVNNREKSRTNVRNRAARKRNAEGSHTPADIAAILNAQGYKCAYCRGDLRKAKRHVDHIQPLAKGGRNDARNIQISCASCNFAKGAKDPLVFAQERGLLL